MSSRILEKIALLFALLCTPCFGEGSIRFDGEPIFIKESLSFFHDEGGLFTFDEIRQREFTEHPRGGFFPGHYWARGNICFTSKGQFSFLHKDLVEGLEIYYGSGNTPKFRHHLLSMSEKMPHVWVRHDMPFIEDPGCQEYFFKFFSNDVLNFELQLMSTKDIDSEEKSYYFLYAIYYAFLILVVLIAATFYIRTRSLTYLFFIALIVTQDFLGTTMLNGLLTHHILSPETLVKYDLGNIFALFMNMALVMFPLYFLNVRNKYLVRISKSIAAIQLLGSLPLLLNFVFPIYSKYWWFSEFVNTSILICCYWSLIVGLFYIKTSLGRLFVFGTGIKIASQIIKTLMLEGDLTENISIFGTDIGFLVFNITAFGAIIEASVLVSSLINEYFRNIENMTARVQEAEKYQAIAESVQMLAHDLKKPYGNLLISLENIEKIDDADRRSKFLKLLKQDVDQKLMNADRMTTEIIDFGKPTKKIRRPENLGTIIHASLLSSVNYVHKKGVNLDTKVANDIWVKVDNVAIMRVFENLFTNALQHMTPGHKIQVQVEKDREFAHILVKNTGSSITKEDLPNIFSPFYSSGHKQGTGLGLAICRKVLLDHGQEIKCETDQFSVTFSFSLPLCRKITSKSIIWPLTSDEILSKSPIYLESEQVLSYDFLEMLEEASDSLGRPIRIAVIEDEDLYRENLMNLLEDRYSEYIQWYPFDNGDRFLQDLQKDFYDLLIVDLHLPEGPGGEEIIKKTRSLGVDSIICVHSSISKSIDIKSIGATQDVPKPMSRQILYGLIKQAVSNKKIDG